jgi:hypothetical protein
MKTLCTLALLFACVSFAYSQDDMKIKGQKTDSTYCLVLKDGLPALTSNDGKEIYNDVLLTNGTKITPNGNVTKKDGTQMVLKEGECVSSSGEISIGAVQRKKKTNLQARE